METMKAVSFMYVRPPGFNPESAKAAEIEDERKRQEQSNPTQDPLISGGSSSMYYSFAHSSCRLLFIFITSEDRHMPLLCSLLVLFYDWQAS